MADTKELQNQLDELQARYERLEQKLQEYELERRQQIIDNFEDVKSYDRLKVLTLKAGIQIYSTTTNLTGFEGELAIISDTNRLAFYKGGSWH